MNKCLELIHLYETALNCAIRSEYENGQDSDTTKSAWKYARNIRARLVESIKND